ncbi:hypothetical protein ES319_A13G223700v1 [Gossypium barbadense]|uniref:Uncharacterized protein n=1 Tax=Gossypium barbadense TaxID=3634 RepID=A0A5J5T331_GOSBA|nr:hypothetical protein ES319_A13G223700v1 [Gossypium barbadense]
MASLSLTSITPQPTTGFSLKNSNNYSNPTTKFLAKKRHVVLTLATPSPQTSSSTTSEKPEIELEFLGPKPGSDGSYPVDKATAISGQKLLRNIMLDNNIELYAAYKPESWRLACRTIVGNKENSGKVVVQRLPQWKK